MEIGVTVFLVALALINLCVAKGEYDHSCFASACVGAFTAGLCTGSALVGLVGLVGVG